MDVRTIQKQVLIGSQVIFHLKTGQFFTGILTELSRDHAIIEEHGNKVSISLEMIGALEVTEKLEDNHKSTEQMLEVTSIPSITASRPQSNDDSKLSESYSADITRSLLTIEAKYEARIHVAQLDPDSIEFKFPSQEIEKLRRNEAHTAWQNIKSIYDYASKVLELEPRYGRIGRFAYQLSQLAKKHPEAHELTRQAAYSAFLAGQLQNALELWKDVAIATQNPNDWKNVAAIALRNQNNGTVNIALEQYYTKAVIAEEANWFIFINLIRDFLNYNSLLSIIQSKQTLNTDEKQVLFEAGLYLMKVNNQMGLAENYIARAKDTSIEPELLIEFFQHFRRSQLRATVTSLQSLRLWCVYMNWVNVIR